MKKNSRPKLLIANRGEIAIRIGQACSDLDIESVAIFPADDASSLHVKCTDHATEIPGRGPAAYLDIDAVVAAAKSMGCQLVHPGYGFLSESSAFARACADAGLIFVGPTPETLALFGDKASARRLAIECDVPVCKGTAAVDTAGAHAFYAELPPGSGMLIKAVSGGGGRGMRVVTKADDIDAALERASAEALAAFGSGDVYCEELIGEARHIEIQILGDGSGQVVHFGERECSLQRRHQKLMEIAPSPALSSSQRDRISAAALALARHVRYRGLGTFEFLVDRTHPDRFVFIEANPRLQVEHTVTEQAYAVDLVQAQIRTCMGATIEELGLRQVDIPAPRGYAIQLRVNMETMQPDGSARPASGVIEAYDMPAGMGIRVDGFGYPGYSTSPSYDSLLAKIIVLCMSPTYADAVRRARRAVEQTRVSGVSTNLGYLHALLKHPDVVANDVSTRWIDFHATELLQLDEAANHRFFALASTKSETATSAGPVAPEGTVPAPAPIHGIVVQIDVQVGDLVHSGMQIAVLEAMKMQCGIAAEMSGIVRSIPAEVGKMLREGEAILFIEPNAVAGEAAGAEQQQIDPDFIRPDLAEVADLLAMTLDAARADAITKRHAQGGRSARENIDDLVDPGSFIEYGQLAIAAQRSQKSVEQLRRVSPADGLVGGIATINGEHFGAEDGKAVVVAYDFTVMAGTQGAFNHKKQDRLYQLAEDIQRPVVLFAEGGGGRPGDVDTHLTTVAGLDFVTFKTFGRLSGQVPLIGVVHGRCFAGNAVLLGCCDVIISTMSANIGLGGPAMIEGGGLGVFAPEDIGPVSVQSENGVIDVLVKDEREATAVARKYLSYFQGRLTDWSCADQRLLRHAIPENRKRAYEVRAVIDMLADTGMVLELRREFGRSIITAFARIEGQPIGIFANDPMHLGGAIDADAADKVARFIELCNAHGLPLLSLCDTPGFMVGPDAEKTAQVRRVSSMLINSARLSVPLVMVVLRKGYGLGALAMSGGNFQDTVLSVSWPTGEFGGMGLEGAVRLAYKKQLAAIEDPSERQKMFESIVAQAYAHGKAVNMASMVEIDNVIDPAETRRWILNAFQAANRERRRHRTG